MTHEQKPESAEFRTREEQEVYLGARIYAGSKNLTDAIYEAGEHIREAEARGAAEQRRKDAGGNEPVAWALRPEMKLRAAFSAWPAPMATRNDWNVPLYTRPANVAALIAEAVAAEREKSEALIRSLAVGYERMRRVLVDMSATSGPDTSWYRHQADQAVSSVPVIWDIARNPVKASPGECSWINLDGSMAAIREGEQ